MKPAYAFLEVSRFLHYEGRRGREKEGEGGRGGGVEGGRGREWEREGDRERETDGIAVVEGGIPQMNWRRSGERERERKEMGWLQGCGSRPQELFGLLCFFLKC